MIPFLLLIGLLSFAPAKLCRRIPTGIAFAFCIQRAAQQQLPSPQHFQVHNVMAPQEYSGIQKHVPMFLAWQPIVSFAEHRCKAFVFMIVDIRPSHEVVQNRLRTTQQQSICTLYKYIYAESHVQVSHTWDCVSFVLALLSGAGPNVVIAIHSVRNLIWKSNR